MQPTLPTDLQKSAMIVSIQVTCTASILMILVVITCYIFIKRLRSIEFLMIVLTCIGDLITAIAISLAVTYDNTDHPINIDDISQQKTSTVCILQACFVQFGEIFSFVWTANIAYSTKMSVMILTPQERQKKIKIMFVLGFTLPFIFTMIPLISDNYQQSMQPLSDSICQMRGGKNDIFGNLILFLCFYTPLILVIIFNTFCMHEVIKSYKKITSEERVIKEVQHLLLYPIILVICWISFLTLRIICLFSVPKLYTFEIICEATSKLNGFLDGLAYGSNSLMRVFQSKKQQVRSIIEGLESSEISYNDTDTLEIDHSLYKSLQSLNL